MNNLQLTVLMSSYNRVTLMGNLTRNPELRKTKTGATVTELGIALNRVWNGENGQRQEETTFVDVTVWGRNAENAAQYLQKGRSVLIEGRLQLETWQDKQSGQERSKLKVVADSIQFLHSNQESVSPSASSAPPEPVSEDRSGRRSDGDRSDRRPDDRRPDDRRSGQRHEAA